MGNNTGEHNGIGRNFSLIALGRMRGLALVSSLNTQEREKKWLMFSSFFNLLNRKLFNQELKSHSSLSVKQSKLKDQKKTVEIKEREKLLYILIH